MRISKFRVKQGLDLPIAGAPEQKIVNGPQIGTVGLIGDDYVGMKPTMAVKEGDTVKLGQALFEDKKNAGVVYTSPAAGRITAVNRGEKRKFESVVIAVDGDEEVTFESYDRDYLGNLDRQLVVQNLVSSGLWPSFRSRPFGHVPPIDSSPHSIFVTAIDTQPLAPDPAVVLAEPEYERYFIHGLQAISTLTEGDVFLCVRPDSNLPGLKQRVVSVAEFAGPHPAGLPGTHIHMLDPVNESKVVWHLGYQDVVAIGHLFLTGRLMTNRVISIAGPAASEPRLVRTRIGASVDELTANETSGGDLRIVSGSVLSGRTSRAPWNFLGRYHSQISLLEEGKRRELLGWAGLGFAKYSITRAFASALSGVASGGKRFTTSTEGSIRAIVPIGCYEKVMPLDIIATPLLKSLLVQDTETAAALGCLELEEEDLALCTFVCPGKNDYGPLLRKSLTHIEREG